MLRQVKVLTCWHIELVYTEQVPNAQTSYDWIRL